MKQRHFWICTLFASVVAACCFSVVRAATYGELYGRAVDAYQQSDIEAFGAVVENMLELRPDYPDALYLQAVYQARTAKIRPAIETLRHLAAMGLDYPVEDDADFETLHGQEAFEALTKRFRRNGTARGRAAIALTLSDKDFLLEGIAFSSDHQAFYLGSVRNGDIYRITTDGQAQRFISLPQHRLWSAFALDVDPTNDLLVVGTSYVRQFLSSEEESAGGSALAWFSLNQGELVYRCDFAGLPQVQHVLGDLRVHHASGDVFVSDSVGGRVYRVSSGTCEYLPIVSPGRFISPQGLAFVEAENVLYIADYRGGLFAWHEKDQTLKKVSAPRDTTLYGIDGLVFHDGCLVAVQNGFRPHRLLRLCFTDETRIGHSEILASGLPEFDEPTQVTVSGADFYVVANSQWNKYGENGSPVDPTALQSPLVLRVSASP